MDIDTLSLFNCHEDVIIRYMEEVFCENKLENSRTNEVKLGKNMFQKNIIIEEINVIVRNIKREWYQMQNVVIYNSTVIFDDMVYSRNLINQIFKYIIECLQLCYNKTVKQKFVRITSRELSSVASSVINFTKLDEEILLKLSSNSMTNPRCPIYQYFHTHLDINCFMYILNCVFLDAPTNKLEEQLNNILKDLVLLSKKNYRPQSNGDSLVYICPCVKKYWFVLQVISEQKQPNLFWKCFNAIVEKENAYFSLWLLQDIAKLYSYDKNFKEQGKKCDRINENFQILEHKLKVVLQEADSKTILDCFYLIEPLICHLWINSAKIEVYQIIWDYFSKRLNVTNKSNHLTATALTLLQTIDTILWYPKDCDDDFELFVGMLVCHLREYPLHWAKIKGRIYSQLGPNKIKDLTDVGIMHVMVMFLSLANCSFEELSKKTVNFLDSLPQDKKQTALFWNLYTAYILIHLKEERSIEKVASNMVQLLQCSSTDPRSFYLIKEFILNYDYMVKSNANMQLCQWLLINEWLPKYICHCHYTDLNTVLNMLLTLVEKVSAPDSWPFWKPTFTEFIYPSLKQISNNSIVPGSLGKLAAKISILIPQLTSEAFTFFIGESVHPQVSFQFLSVVLDNYPNNYILTFQQESTVLKSWIKINLLIPESIEQLTKNVINLDMFPVKLKCQIENSKDPLVTLFEYLGSDIKQHVQSASIIKLCDTCFGDIDTWLTQYLVQPKCESTILRMYTKISLAFLYCGPLLYNRNKSTCPLTRLVSSMLLPTDFLVGKTPNSIILLCVKKTWHIYFEAIVKLSDMPDSFLERTQRDLIIRYMPYFSTNDSPIFKCLEKELTAKVILEKISNAYFKHPTKEQDQNVFKALQLIGNCVESTTSVPLLKLIVNKTLCGLFEVVIFHAQKNTAINILKSITVSPLYPKVKVDFLQTIIIITEKHLGFNALNYFHLINILTKFIPDDIRGLVGNIKQVVGNVERMRGVGFDKTLRHYLEKLEKSL